MWTAVRLCIKATKRIADAIEGCPTDQRPSALVNASAIGYYGTSETATYDETAPAGGDYLSKVCQAWESTAEDALRDTPDVRVVLLRLGIVLDRNGGALGKMLPTFQLFAGGPMGEAHPRGCHPHTSFGPLVIFFHIHVPLYGNSNQTTRWMISGPGYRGIIHHIIL